MCPRHIAVLGGGLTGLSAAFYLTRRFPRSFVSLFERESRWGGWVRSERVELEAGSVLLEAGPRTLRPNAKALMELIHLLALEKYLITTPSTSPAAKTRFIHLPDHPGLLPVPTTLPSILSLSLPLSSVLVLLREPFRRANRPGGITDESFEAFLTRRFGERFARIFGSALVHGVYAADARCLSVRAAFPMLWEAEERGKGSVLMGLMRRREVEEDAGYVLGDVEKRMEGVSVYSFRDGLETITRSLKNYLETRSTVRLFPGVGIDSLRVNRDKSFEIRTNTGDVFNPTHIVSALPLSKLHTILCPSTPLPHMTTNSTSSVTVINLVFPSSPSNPIHPPGFGYLVPRPKTDYHTQNSGILGTVFDSCTTSAQDTLSTQITKLTVMIGGPHPITPAHTSPSVVLKHLGEQMGTDLPEPLFCRVHHHKECIPMPAVGHVERMRGLLKVLREEPWEGRMEVVGAGVGGVSMGDCVRAGREVGKNWH